MQLRYISLAFVLVLLNVHLASCKRVLLRDVQVLTLRANEMTAHGRTRAVPQLRCVGGSNRCKFTPKVVQCYNRGFDGSDVQWECRADLPFDLHFGKLSVNCEGYNYPDDPYVLAGSCGLEYTIDRSSDYGEPKGSGFGRMFWIALMIFLIWFLYKVFASPFTSFRWGGGGGGGNGGGFPSYGFRRPGFFNGGDSCYSGSNIGGSSWPGFWSGLGLGALGGYQYGRRSSPASSSFSGFGSPDSSYASRFSRDDDRDTVSRSGFASTTRR